MNTQTPPSRWLVWTVLVALALASLALNYHSLPMQQGAATPPGLMAAPANGPGDEAGSTDGIVLMAVIILLIILTPILLRRRDWENGKKKMR